VNATFTPELAVGVGTDHLDLRMMDAGRGSFQPICDGYLEREGFQVPEIHSLKLLSPIHRVDAAGARLDRDDRVPKIVVAVEERLSLDRLKPCSEFRKDHGDLSQDRGVHDRIRQFKQLGLVLKIGRQGSYGVGDLTEVFLFFDQRSSGVRTAPEIWSTHPPLNLQDALGVDMDAKATPRGP